MNNPELLQSHTDRESRVADINGKPITLFSIKSLFKKSKVQIFDTPQVSTVLRSNLMRLYLPVDLTGNLIMIEKLVSGGT